MRDTEHWPDDAPVRLRNLRLSLRNIARDIDGLIRLIDVIESRSHRRLFRDPMPSDRPHRRDRDSDQPVAERHARADPFQDAISGLEQAMRALRRLKRFGALPRDADHRVRRRGGERRLRCRDERDDDGDAEEQQPSDTAVRAALARLNGGELPRQRRARGR
jgi:hypothetical protein